MPKRSASSNSKNNGKKRKFTGAGFPSKGKREIVFDPEARKAYLRGFSERKRQRRAYGLAMQQVKDRKAKLEDRKQTKKDELKRVEEAEQQKAALMKEEMKRSKHNDREDENKKGEDEGSSVGSNEMAMGKEHLDTRTYDDQATETHWGGHVTVTTSVVDLGEGDNSDEGDDEDISAQIAEDKKSVDHQQRYAGNVEKFMTKLKGNMPGKKAAGHHARRKGRNGAVGMKGIGGASNFKVVQKVLSKAKSKSKQGSNPGQGKGKQDKKKSRR